MRSVIMWVAWAVARFLRYVGWGALLLPLALMLMTLYGVHLWTVAVAGAALLLAVARPLVAAALLPAALASTAVCGLAVGAAASRGVPVAVNYRVTAGRTNANGQAVFSFVSTSPKGPSSYITVITNGNAAEWTQLRDLITTQQRDKAIFTWAATSKALSAHQETVLHTLSRQESALAATILHVPTTVIVPAGWWRGDLLIPMSLLLLIAGLWLAPRTLGRVREPVTRLVPHLLTRFRQNYWGVLLVPVAAFGLAVLGVHAWAIGAVVAAAAIAVAWPALAADLIPAVLTGFAACGYLITVAWQSLPPGGHRAAQWYGLVHVHSQGTAIMAAVQASVLLVLAGWLVPRTLGAHVRLVTGPPAPDPVLAGRVRRLTETREHAIDAANSELLRIERDLHDGAQARLVALGMNLRAMQRLLPDQPDAALALVGEAQETSLRALTELRSLIRGIYPPVLADRGLAEAVQALALDTPLPTALDIDLPGRLTAPVEAACYFAVAEALANAVQHAGAHEIHVRIGHDGSMLRIEVADDGTGGADPAAGTGLSGIERRLGTFDGILAVSSPTGGPTMIVMEVPCRLTVPAAGRR